MSPKVPDQVGFKLADHVVTSEDGVTPYFIFWKHGLKEMKV